MRSFVLALAATALVATTGVDARGFQHRRNAHANAHAMLDARGYNASSTCPPRPCTTYVTTTWVPYNAPQTITHVVPSYVTVVPVESKSTSTSHIQVTVTVTPSYAHPVPTPSQTTCPTPGVYTIPAQTITLTSTETVCVATSTVVPPGTHTLGQTVTVVSTATTVTCPYATTVTSNSAVYTTIYSTTIVCPAAGTYTYGGMTTTVTETATCYYPVTTQYNPGTYTAPEQTVTVTETSKVIVCPYATSSAAPAPAPVTTSAAAPVYYAATSSAAPAPATTSAAPVYYVATSSAAAPASSAPSSHGHSSGGLGAGPMWGITYSPYDNGGACKSQQAIETDIADIASKGFKTVRIYSTECSGLQYVGGACETHGLKLVIGIFIKSGYAQSDLDSQLQDIITWGKYELVELIVIGNESLFNGWISSSALATLISSYKAQLVAAGCNVPVTTAETLGSLQSNSGLCQVIDVVGCNIHPYFNPSNDASTAGTFVQTEMQLCGQVCSKTAYCLEAGWPSAGNANGNAIPGQSQQQQALESIYHSDTGNIMYFTYTNDIWKPTGPLGVEQSFGCSQLFPLH